MNAKKMNQLTYKFLEQELLNLGEEAAEINKILDGETEEPPLPRIYYVRRGRWLNRIFDELEDLCDKVDKTTWRIIWLLYIDNASFEAVSKETNKELSRIKTIHKLVVNAIAEKLGMINIGTDILKESSRYLTEETKRKVNERYGGECAICKSKEKLHFHHIERFADGGSNDADNLMLLCADCHAEEHKGERVYYALKAIAKE